mgnify:CR=1 FL=1
MLFRSRAAVLITTPTVAAELAPRFRGITLVAPDAATGDDPEAACDVVGTTSLHAAVAKGMRADDAATLARTLVWADLRGTASHGVSRIPRYMEMIAAGELDTTARVSLEEKGPSLLLMRAARVGISLGIVLYILFDVDRTDLVRTLKADGLDGVEVHYSTHTPRQTRDYLALAKQQGLLVTGGSDFHGLTKPDIGVGIGKGSLHVPDSLLDKMKSAAARS